MLWEVNGHSTPQHWMKSLRDICKSPHLWDKEKIDMNIHNCHTLTAQNEQTYALCPHTHTHTHTHTQCNAACCRTRTTAALGQIENSGHASSSSTMYATSHFLPLAVFYALSASWIFLCYFFPSQGYIILINLAVSWVTSLLQFPQLFKHILL